MNLELLVNGPRWPRSSPDVSVISSKAVGLLPIHEHHLLRLSLFAATSCQLAHVQVASASYPLLRELHRQGTREPQACLAVREDPNHPRAALYLLVETLEAIGRADTSTAAFREREAAKALLHVLLDV